MTFCIKVLHRLSYTVGIVTADSCHKGIFDVVIKHYHGYVMPTVALDKVNMRAKSEEKDTLVILINGSRLDTCDYLISKLIARAVMYSENQHGNVFLAHHTLGADVISHFGSAFPLLFLITNHIDNNKVL